jgi:hypothetical protein
MRPAEPNSTSDRKRPTTGPNDSNARVRALSSPAVLRPIIAPTLVETLALARKRLGLLSTEELEKAAATRPKHWIVENLIPEGSVNVGIGDSGLGKSPLFYQMGVSVSEGIPFLGHSTTKGLVVYVDFENGLLQIHGLIRRIAEHVGLTRPPEELLTWSYGAANKPNVGQIITSVQPRLLIIDSLRDYEPEAEKENSTAAKLLQDLRVLARKYGTAFLLIHHTRKPGESGRPPLENIPIMDRLDQASGARALINQSDVRIGLDRPRAAHEGVALVIKGHERVVGEFGPFFVAREFGNDGDPLGYSRMTGAQLLFNPEHENAFEKLPPEFSFKDAKHTYGKHDSATDHFLKKCINVGIVTKIKHGRYAKVVAHKVVK